MEFNEKLQMLRKQRGLTQEGLAESLFVSRTAISKWESGRGYPSIDSLKAISNFFSVTIDELLSGDEVLSIAEEDTKQKETRIRSRVFALLDLSAVLFCFLPIFGQTAEGSVQSVSLSALAGVAPWLKVCYFVIVIGIIAAGALNLALINGGHPLRERFGDRASLVLNALGVLIFILSRQAYAAGFLFVFLLVKLLTLFKRR